MNDYEKLEWLHYAVQEIQNEVDVDLDKMLELIEDLREKEMKKNV